MFARGEEEPARGHTPTSQPTPIKEKFSSLKPTPPSAGRLSPSAGRPHLSPEDLRDSERTAQKERLHEELKRVLRLKVRKESGGQTGGKMEPQITITEEKLQSFETVSVVVETEAEAGVSGFSVSGGGRDGVFISEVVRDSPAAQTLRVLEGDQILSARVFFENIRREEAVKLLQYVEPFKVSFCLKRVVPSADVSVSATSGSVEVKSPKAKMPKMAVKSLTPVKKKKPKASGEESVPEETSAEAVRGSDVSVGSLEIPPVGVEFSFPKFSKFLKTKSAAEAGGPSKVTEVTTKASDGEQKWAKMKFPRLRVKEAAAGGPSAAAPEGKAELEKGGPRTQKKDKAGPVFGISAPKMKTPEVAVTTPQVELDLPLPTLKGDTQETPAREGIKMAAAKIPDVEIKVPAARVEADVHGSKMAAPRVSGICSPSLDEESDVALRVDGRPKTEFQLPTLEVAPPKLDVDLTFPKVDAEVETLAVTGKGLQIKLPTFGLSTKGPEGEPEAPGRRLKKEAEGKATDEKSKTPSLRPPEVGISLPKGKPEAGSPEGERKIPAKLPVLDVSAPKVDFDLSLPKVKTDSEFSGDVALKMAKASPPKPGMKVKEAYGDPYKVKAAPPQPDPRAVKVEAESSASVPDVTLKMPKIGLPKFGAEEEADGTKVTQGDGHDFKISGPKIKLPSLGLSLAKEKPEVTLHEEAETEGKMKFPSVKVPSLDISLPKVSDIHPGKLEVAAPAAKVEVKAPTLGGADSLDSKFKVPGVSLPKLDVSAKVEKPHASPPQLGIHAPKAKEGEPAAKGDHAFTLPKVDISVPKVKPAEPRDLDEEKPKVGLKLPKVGSDAIAFHGEAVDTKVGFGSIKLPSLELDAPKMDVGLDLPKAGGSEPLVEGPEGKSLMPKMSLQRFGDVAKEMAVEINVPKIAGDVSAPRAGAEIKKSYAGEEGAKISLPKVELGLGRSDVELEEKVDIEPAGAKVELPPVKLPSVAISVPKLPEVDIDASLPKVSLEGPGVEEAAVEVGADGDAKGKGSKFSLRKLGFSGPKVKKGGEGETRASHEDGEAEVAVRSPKIKMPKFGITFPKSKQEAGGESTPATNAKPRKGKADVSGGQAEASAEGKAKFPSVGISAPKLEVDIAIPKDTTGKPSDISIDIPEVKMSLPKFSMPKFGGKTKGSEEEEEEAEEAAKPRGGAKKSAGGTDTSSDGGSSDGKGRGRMKMPTIKMPSFGMSKKEADVKVEVGPPEVKVKTTKTSAKETKVGVEGGDDKTPFLKMPTFKMSPPKVKAPAGDLAIKGSREDLQLPNVKVKVPQVELPSLGFKGDPKEKSTPGTEAKGEPELSLSAPKPELSLSAPKPELSFSAPKPELSFSAPKLELSFSAPKPELSFSEPKPELSFSAPKLELSLPTPKPELSLPTPKPELSLPTPKPELSFSAPKSELSLSAPKPELSLPTPKSELSISAPKLELSLPTPKPELSFSAPKSELSISAPKSELSFSAPKLELSLPTPKPELSLSAPKVEVDVSASDIKGYGGDLKIPQISVPVPDLQLDVGFTKAGPDSSSEQEAKVTLERSDGRLKMPKVELPKFGESERSADAKGDVEGAKYKMGAEVEPKVKGSKIRMPHFDISLPKVRLDGAEEEEETIPFIEGDLKAHGLELEAEGGFSLPSVELPKMSTPKIRAPELELDVGGVTGPEVKLKMPKVKLPKFGGHDEEEEEETTGADDKTQKAEGGKMGLKIKMPKLQMGSPRGKAGEEVLAEAEGHPKKTSKEEAKEDSEYSRMFRMKIPSLAMTKESGDAGRETSRLDLKMPQISIPDVGFGEGEGHAEVKTKGVGSSTFEGLDVDLKMPKIKMATAGRKTDGDRNLPPDEDSEGRRSLFKMPDVEISAPKVKGRAEYDVGGAEVEGGRSEEMETELIATRKSSEAKEESEGHPAEEAGRKYKVKLPKFAISLPKSVPGDVEFSKIKPSAKGVAGTEREAGDQQEGKRGKRNIFSLGKSKDRSAAGLLTSDGDTTLEAEGQDLKVKMPKIKMKPNFRKGKTRGAEVNGESEAAAGGEAEAEITPDGGKASRVKLPRLGFSAPAGGAGDASVNGSGSPGDGEREGSGRRGSPEGGAKVGKLRFPKVEFSSTYKVKEGDSEVHLKLVKGDEPEAHEGSFTSKLKSLPGFKKKEKGEEHRQEHRQESAGEGEAKAGRAKISLGFLSGRSKGEYEVDNSGIETDPPENRDRSKYKIPKLSLGSQSEAETPAGGNEDVLGVRLPKVAFTTHHEEHTVEEEKVAGGLLTITTTKQIKTETVTEKTLSI